MAARCVPMFHVPDVRETIEWYRSIGFGVVETFGDGDDALSFAIVSFGPSEVMFNAGGVPSAAFRREVDLYVYTDDVAGLHERLKDRVDVVEGPHDTFYGMREVIIRDVNRFWITFGETITAPTAVEGEIEVDVGTLERYVGTYASDTGSSVRITCGDGKLMALPDGSHAVRLAPLSEAVFRAVGMADATVTFETRDGVPSGLVFTEGDSAMRFAPRKTPL